MTKSLKVAVCASLLLGSVFTGFANVDPIDSALEQLIKPTNDAFVELANQATTEPQVQEATASVTEKVVQKAGEYADKAKDGLKDAGTFVLGKGSEFSEWAKESASKVKDDLKNAGNAALEKGSELSGQAKEGLAKLYDFVLGKGRQTATDAYNQIEPWVANHPYLAATAVVTPIALFIGYKLGKAKPAEDHKNNR